MGTEKMNKDLGIMKGEWKIVPTPKVESHLDIAVNAGDNHVVAWVYSESYTGNKEQGYNNAKLIADAGNTAQKCNMLPGELLEKYEEAKSLCEKYLKNVNTGKASSKQTCSDMRKFLGLQNKQEMLEEELTR